MDYRAIGDMGAYYDNEGYIAHTLKVFGYAQGIAAGEGTIPVRLTLDAETPAGIEVTASARLADLRARIPFENIYHTRAGCTVSGHCGPGTLGILFYRKEK